MMLAHDHRGQCGRSQLAIAGAGESGRRWLAAVGVYVWRGTKIVG